LSEYCIQTRIFGTRGELEGDGTETISHFDFLTREKRIFNVSQEIPIDSNTPQSGHGGGDFGITRAFVYACVTGNQAFITSGPKQTLGM